MTSNNSTGVYDLDALIAQRKEATGVDGDRVSFNFAGDVFTFLDPVFLDDDKVDELSDMPSYGPDICAWYMGEDEYDRFIAAGGSSNLWGLVLNEHLAKARAVDPAGNPTTPNRSRRRAAARKR